MTDIVSILRDHGIEMAATNNPSEIRIRCTSGSHEDATPSMMYNLDRNVFNCFSCGFSGSTIKFLQSLGINTKVQIESKQEYRISKLQKALQEVINQNCTSLPKDASPYYGTFRGISKQTMEEFGAFLTGEYNLEDYICFPVYQYGKLRFINGRLRLQNSSKPKYVKKPNSISTSHVLFPIDKLKNTRHVILVEGLTDMLNLWDKGYNNVLCIFGATSFSHKKVEILNQIGTTRVTIMMDGDTAGQVATEKIEQLLDKNDISTNKIYLKADEDPGSLTTEQMEYYLRNEK